MLQSSLVPQDYGAGVDDEVVVVEVC